jgi:periplasmic divalent cation tolerance protein
MGEAEAISVVVSSVPDATVGLRLAGTLVEERLAACATLLPEVTSVYRWEGRLRQEAEQLLLVKTASARVPRLIERLAELHPYQLPEILAFRVAEGLPEYCRWVLAETGG